MVVQVYIPPSLYIQTRIISNEEGVPSTYLCHIFLGS